MIENSTYSDLLSYAYNETDLSDGDRIQRLIDGDPLIEAEYKELTATIKILDDAKPEIDPESIRKILQFV